MSQSVSKKNEIRENIRSFFQSVDAFTLPVPSDKQEVLKHMSNPEYKKYINIEFVEKLERLKILITKKYQPKKGMNDTILAGSRKFANLGLLIISLRQA